LLLGCDLITAASAETLPTLAPDRARAVVNAHETMTAAFTHDPDADFPEMHLRESIAAAARADCAPDFVDASGLAQALLGDPVGANMLLLGFACQKGFLPVGPAAIAEAIVLNGVAPEMNRRAFAWGRMLALDALAVARAAGLPAVAPAPADRGGLDGFVLRRAGAPAAGVCDGGEELIQKKIFLAFVVFFICLSVFLVFANPHPNIIFERTKKKRKRKKQK
jgi:hypothetical protein